MLSARFSYCAALMLLHVLLLHQLMGSIRYSTNPVELQKLNYCSYYTGTSAACKLTRYKHKQNKQVQTACRYYNK
jgi:hypothetical protein